MIYDGIKTTSITSKSLNPTPPILEGSDRLELDRIKYLYKHDVNNHIRHLSNFESWMSEESVRDGISQLQEKIANEKRNYWIALFQLYIQICEARLTELKT